MKDILKRIEDERIAQYLKWGQQDHPSFDEDEYYGLVMEAQAKTICEEANFNQRLTWPHILIEEVSEAVYAKTNEKRIEELIQVAAVAVAWIESLQRKESETTEVTIKISREEIQTFSRMSREESNDHIALHYGIDKSRILGGMISDETTMSPTLTLKLLKK
jgi:hypothetical protein